MTRQETQGGDRPGWARQLLSVCLIAAVVVPVIYTVRAYPDETRLWGRIFLLEARQLLASFR